MHDIQSLKDRKGELSRMIGAAKKSGEPIDHLLTEMKEISVNLKQIESQKKASKKRQVNESFDTSDDSSSIPQLFKPKATCPVDGVSVNEVVPSDEQDWDQFVRDIPGSSAYHGWSFKTLIEQSFGHSTFYMIARDANHRVVGICPLVELNSPLFGHFLVSVPFFNYGAPLALSEEIEGMLAEAAFAKAKTIGAGHVELRSTHARSGLLEKQTKVSMIRPLPETSDQLWSDIGTKVRAQIKKADRFDLRIVFGKRDLVDDYYRVFSENMRDLGTPVYSKSLFRNLFECVDSKHVHIAVVYQGAKPISAGFLIGHKDTLEIPWASTLREANQMNANMYMYWHILKFAVDQGYQFFDFGRSSKDANTYRFKKQWGATPHQLYWHYWLSEGDDLPEINPDNPKYKLLIAVWRRLPVFVANIIGPFVVKYLP